MWALLRLPRFRGATGLDIAKSVFQVHGVDAAIPSSTDQYS
jgi:hypothetical protein